MDRSSRRPTSAGDRPQLSIDIREELNPMWKMFYDYNRISLPMRSFLTSESKVFSMGSCFAVEIRAALAESGVDVFPKYRGMRFDPDRVRIGALPARDNLNHYHTFSILQEFQKFHGQWRQADQDVWRIEDHVWNSGRPIFQDPYRRSVFARSEDDLMNAIAMLDEVIWEGIRCADIFLITLGLIEVWRKRDGRYSCEFPGYNRGGGYDDLEFHLSTYQENYDNLKETVRLIAEVNPTAQIVFTVSPVWLGRTFTSEDVYVANMESKSLLRAAAGQICRESVQAEYFPSYELATALMGDAHASDGRHVRPETVAFITRAFLTASSGGALGGPHAA